MMSFNRRRDACFPATSPGEQYRSSRRSFNRRRDACFPATNSPNRQKPLLYLVSIADATLASPQRRPHKALPVVLASFNRRRDACFPATIEAGVVMTTQTSVSIADATLASPQRSNNGSENG